MSYKTGKECSIGEMTLALLLYNSKLYVGDTHEATLAQAQKEYMDKNGYSGKTLSREEYNDMFNNFCECDCFAFGIHKGMGNGETRYLVGNEIEDIEALSEMQIKSFGAVILAIYGSATSCLILEKEGA